MKHIILTIDTSSNKEITVSVDIDGKVDSITEEIGRQKSQILLPRIITLLQRNNLTLSDLTHITLPLGPGSFTGLRVGASIANTLATLLHIPINGNPPGVLVEPVYQ